jgi:hypothetical protein
VKSCTPIFFVKITYVHFTELLDYISLPEYPVGNPMIWWLSTTSLLATSPCTGSPFFARSGVIGTSRREQHGIVLVSVACMTPNGSESNCTFQPKLSSTAHSTSGSPNGRCARNCCNLECRDAQRLRTWDLNWYEIGKVTVVVISNRIISATVLSITYTSFVPCRSPTGLSVLAM